MKLYKNKIIVDGVESSLNIAVGGGTTDANITYALSKENNNIILTGSDGSITSVLDSNTTYSNATNSAAGLMSKDDKAKLDGIAEGANNYKHPANHAATMITQDATHRFVSDTQIANWNAKADTKADVGLGNVTNDAQVKRSEMGAASGVATLGSNGKVPSSQLPSYVDDVIEYNGMSNFPSTGESSKIYIDTSTNKTYRWSGTTYVEISASIVVGTTTGTAFDGKIGNDHINNKSNPHGVTKAQVGLSNVENKSSATIRGELTMTNVTDALGYTPASTEIATSTSNGLMSAADKEKLNNHILNIPTFNITATSISANTDSYSSIYPYYYDYSNSLITANHQPIVSLSPLSFDYNYAYEQCDTQAGKIRLYFTEIPSGTIIVDHIVLINMA